MLGARIIIQQQDYVYGLRILVIAPWNVNLLICDFFRLLSKRTKYIKREKSSSEIFWVVLIHFVFVFVVLSYATFCATNSLWWASEIMCQTKYHVFLFISCDVLHALFNALILTSVVPFVQLPWRWWIRDALAFRRHPLYQQADCAWATPSVSLSLPLALRKPARLRNT